MSDVLEVMKTTREEESGGRRPAIALHGVAAVLLAAAIAARMYPDAVDVLADEGVNDAAFGAGALSLFVAVMSIPLYFTATAFAGLPMIGALTLVSRRCSLRTAVGYWLLAAAPIAVRSIVVAGYLAATELEAVVDRLAPVPFVDPVSILTSLAVVVVLRHRVGTSLRFAVTVAVVNHTVVGAVGLLAAAGS